MNEGSTFKARVFELPPTEPHLNLFQERLLQQVQLAPLRGHHKNLIVAALELARR